MKHWLVAYVRLHHEKKTRDRLTSLGVECFLPLQTEFCQWSDRVKRAERLVIPLMIFVRVDLKERSLVLTLPAISRYLVLRGESVPAIIPDEQMDRFRFMLDHSDEAVEMCESPLKAGQHIRVIKGPLTGLEGELIKVGKRTKVAVRLEMLGCALVEVPVGFVERVEKK